MAKLKDGTLTSATRSSAVTIDSDKPLFVTIGRTGTSFSATVRLERTADGGTTWTAVSTDSAGTAASYTSDACLRIEDDETGGTPIQYSLNCTSYTSGTIYYRFGQ